MNNNVISNDTPIDVFYVENLFNCFDKRLDDKTFKALKKAINFKCNKGCVKEDNNKLFLCNIVLTNKKFKNIGNYVTLFNTCIHRVNLDLKDEPFKVSYRFERSNLKDSSFSYVFTFYLLIEDEKEEFKTNHDDMEKVEFPNRHNQIATEEMEFYVKDTLRILNDSVSMTLGPYAKTTIVEDRNKHHVITKDGYTVLRSLCFEDDISRTIFEIVLKVSKRLVRTSGDGSSSSIVIAYHLYENILPLIKNNIITSKDILDILSDLAKNLEDEIKKRAKPISEDMHELQDIAAISCNNDQEKGRLIMDIFKEIGRYGFINLETSMSEKTYYELKNGYEIPRGYISDLMVNQADKKTVILEEPKVLMIDGMVTEKDLDALANFLGVYSAQIGGSVVIIASGYSNEAHTFFHMNRLNAIRNNNDKLFSVVAIDIATKDSDNRNKFEDLAINLGCKPIRLVTGDSLTEYNDNAQLLLTKCGSCKKFKGDEFNSKFIEGNGKITPSSYSNVCRII
jgi:hypothetical protein